MRKLLITSSLLIAVSGTISYIVNKPIPVTATDEPPIVVEVQKHDEQLANHEARITNSEANISVLQSNINIPVPTDVKTVPAVTTVVPAAKPATTQPNQTQVEVTIVSYEQIPVENTDNVDCKLAYSDGTTKQWHWRTVWYNQGTQLSSASGRCDASVVGNIKN